MSYSPLCWFVVVVSQASVGVYFADILSSVDSTPTTQLHPVSPLPPIVLRQVPAELSLPTQPPSPFPPPSPPSRPWDPVLLSVHGSAGDEAWDGSCCAPLPVCRRDGVESAEWKYLLQDERKPPPESCYFRALRQIIFGVYIIYISYICNVYYNIYIYIYIYDI